MKIFKIVNFIPVVFFLACFSSNTFADPNALLGEAIKKSLSINQNLPTEERLSAYKEIFVLTDKIITDHPSSDQTIKLLSNQKIGDFDQATLRANYIKELTEYFDIVCETSPNFLCLGFVSLSAGQKGCSTANTVREIVEAHQNLKNAVNVFSSQQSDASFVSIALDQYRTCLNSSPYEATDYSKDLFSIDLTKMLLKLGRESTAKAMIQNMKTPAFKVSGVLALAESQGKTFDRAFFDRLIKYIDEKVEAKDGNQANASLELAKGAFENGTFSISYDDLRKKMYGYTDFGSYAKNCEPFYVRNILEKVFELQMNVVGLDKSRRGYNKGQVPNIMEQISDRYGGIGEEGRNGVLNSCRDKSKDTGEYKLSTQLHGQILLLSKDAAEKFRKVVMNEDWTSIKQINFAVETLGKHKDLFEAEYGLTEKAKGSDIIKFEQILKSERALFPVYRQLVNYGNVCESSKILFQKIKGKNFYDDAIEYMINSDSIDMSVKHTCGDSELELLLN